MILKNFKTITPTRRFIFFYQVFIQDYLKKKYLFNKIRSTKTKKNLNLNLKSTHVKSIKTYPTVVTSYLTPKTFSSVLTNFYLHPNKKKLFSFFQNVYNLNFIVQTTDKLFVGFKFLSLQKQINQPFIIDYLPYYSKVCLITLNFFKKIIFCKSSGSSATKLLFTKKNKLTLIELPSNARKFIPYSSVCILGEIFDLKTNICWKGKFKNNKKIKLNVRGVAMNPVDHPNGGRTKAKQPEKSPWGWIAKHNK